ncbi:phospho-sugar mutase [Nakamurella deserti]|uniref:phospho-sugar mutase n=1 Tax=Nakamurella deserti TaxID=2164074 RepID=UPI001F0C501A|nr:phospho-sugar mutase [Nakamurella deserti]
MTAPDRLGAAARTAAMRWIADDPHAGDRAEFQQLVSRALGTEQAAVTEVVERLTPLTFGTAGLRGPLRAGPGGMNLATVRRTAAGLAAHLSRDGVHGTVVVGYDGRHRSAEFAADAAGVLAAAGFTALLAPGALPTPVTAYAVRALGAVAGVQITASHNPPQDNGIKVYLAGGAQLISPEDRAIEAAIAASRPAVSIDASGTPAPWPADLLDDYIAAAATAGGTVPPTPVRIVATALHGVGGQTLVRTLRAAGFDDVRVVGAQAVPDGDFPTVAFPNPEEPGATDLLLALAEEAGADLAIANDPDADRLAVGARFVDGWRMLSGDETGCLLGDFLLGRLDRAAHPAPLAATTIVSSTLLRSVAEAHDVRFAETLTGFKWIVRAGDGAGTGLVYGYEEALGLCVQPDVVRDKDGISAAVVAAKLVATLKADGGDISGALDDLARRFGLHVTDQLSFRVADLSLIADAMRRLRADPPTTLMGDPVQESQDLLPATDALIYRSTRLRVVVRPSGTEPKLKCYLELVGSPGTGADLGGQRAAARADLATLRAELTAALGL